VSKPTHFRQLNDGWNAEPNDPDPSVSVDRCDVVLTFLANPFRFPRFSEDQRLRLKFTNARRYRLTPRSPSFSRWRPTKSGHQPLRDCQRSALWLAVVSFVRHVCARRTEHRFRRPRCRRALRSDVLFCVVEKLDELRRSDDAQLRKLRRERPAIRSFLVTKVQQIAVSGNDERG